MKKFLLILTSLAIFAGTAISQITYEDFEGSSGLTWSGINGTYDGIVDNPAPDAVNMSAKCASFTKDGAQEWSFMITEFAAPIDLSTNTEFKISLYAPVATKFLFKLEGTDGNFEQAANIANANVWQEYTLDLSAAAGNSGITKIVIFFNFGTADDGDTYLVDNIQANPAGPCAGTIPDPLIVDDYECQRNASYGGGWDNITAVANPDATGANTSTMVGQYTDPLDEWSALVVDYNDPIDLSTNNNIKAKIWAPKAGRVLFKLEGGVSPAAEVFVDVAEANTWVEYSADFSAQAAANHKKIAIFFNAGVLAEDGDVYYIDDIGFAAPPPPAALEDFENGANLGWEPFNGDTDNHGTFDGVQANPDPSGINDSPNVGKYTKGNAVFSTLSAFLPNGIDLTGKPQLNLQVRAPQGAATVTMQLVSATQGAKEVTRDITEHMVWTQLEFNFEDFESVTDFESINLLFDGGTAGGGISYMFDNLLQGSSTVDPCEGVAPIPNIYDDFECQRNVTYVPGDDRLKVVDNPDVSPDNPSLSVGEYSDPIDEWSALGFETGSPVDLSVLNQFHIKIWSPAVVPLLFKLEGGSSPAAEVWTDVSEANKWVEYVVDFSANAGEDHGKIVVFFNGGQLPGQEDIYYLDDVSWTRAAYTGCIDDHETDASTLDNFSYFANGHLEAEGYQFEVVDNPNRSGINESAKVGKFIKASDSDPWAGMFGDLDAPIDFGANKTAKAKVHMDHIGNFAVKLEASRTGADNIELPVENTVMNEWEELTFDFSSAPDDAEFMRITLFFDLSIDATGVDVSSYFDDIVIGDGTCTVGSGLFTPTNVAQFNVYPNPVNSRLYIENHPEVQSLAIYNLFGQKIRSVKSVGASTLEIDASGMKKGMYLLSGYNLAGQLVANAKFVKN